MASTPHRGLTGGRGYYADAASPIASTPQRKGPVGRTPGAGPSAGTPKVAALSPMKAPTEKPLVRKDSHPETTGAIFSPVLKFVGADGEVSMKGEDDVFDAPAAVAPVVLSPAPPPRVAAPASAAAVAAASAPPRHAASSTVAGVAARGVAGGASTVAYGVGRPAVAVAALPSPSPATASVAAPASSVRSTASDVSMGGAGAGGSSVAVRSHVAAAAVVAAPAVAAAAVADPYADAGDDGEGEADEFEVEEFNPYLFIKLLPPYHAVVARPPRAVLPVKPRRSPDVSLVLDLDETLVHCSVDPIPDADLTFPVNFNGINYQVYVRKRPHLDRFLRHAADQFEVTIFTASQQVYAERLLNLLDPSGILIHHRLYRDSCLNVDGNYLKDLNVLGRDLRKTVLVDNSPHAFGYQVDNGIPIESWFDDRADTELLKLLGFLETLHGTEDVRPSIRAKFAVHRLVETAR